jgi:hypothetical protein
MNFLQELPNKLRIELSKIMHDNVIQKLYFFKNQPPDFIAYVAPLLKPVKFSQNDFLYKIGDMIDESRCLISVLCGQRNDFVLSQQGFQRQRSKGDKEKQQFWRNRDVLEREVNI